MFSPSCLFFASFTLLAFLVFCFVFVFTEALLMLLSFCAHRMQVGPCNELLGVERTFLEMKNTHNHTYMSDIFLDTVGR